ncbi:hypothetical protein E2C01_033478 [Portunus trituberculatus]|uniref:Uncharacterized protein n=1 Tax=Portunus trituberculatus TaxID=210409 RepID=A0A5B7F5M3_PORTR|nr:hypothetical protein [Portunus trituberculatus]
MGSEQPQLPRLPAMLLLLMLLLVPGLLPRLSYRARQRTYFTSLRRPVNSRLASLKALAAITAAVSGKHRTSGYISSRGNIVQFSEGYRIALRVVPTVYLTLVRVAPRSSDAQAQIAGVAPKRRG